MMAHDGLSWLMGGFKGIHLQEVPAEETVEDPEEDETMQKLWKARTCKPFQRLSQSFNLRLRVRSRVNCGQGSRVSSGEVRGMVPVRFNDRILQHLFCLAYCTIFLYDLFLWTMCCWLAIVFWKNVVCVLQALVRKVVIHACMNMNEHARIVKPHAKSAWCRHDRSGSSSNLLRAGSSSVNFLKFQFVLHDAQCSYVRVV